MSKNIRIEDLDLNKLVIREMMFGELEIILARFQIMLETEPDRYDYAEFIQQEHFRRDLFKNNPIKDDSEDTHIFFK
jgi:hypothetical protein